MAFTNNKIKMATSVVPNGCIGKDTMQLGVDQTVTFGPTSSTGFWNGIKPQTNEWTVYLTKASQGPSIYVTSDLVGSTKQISGNNSITTESQAVNWYFTQTDKLLTNRTFPSLYTNNLKMAFDSAFPPCYNRSTSVYDMAGSHHALLTNGGWDGEGLIIDNNDPNPINNGKFFIVNQTFSFQTISLWIKTKNIVANDYFLFDSATNGFKSSVGLGIGPQFNGNSLYRNGSPIGSLTNVNQLILNDNKWWNFVITLPSPTSANKFSFFSDISGTYGTLTVIGEVYGWLEQLSDTQANNHFNEFCSKYNIC